MPKSDIPWALAELREGRRRDRYLRARRYYNGDHEASFDVARFNSIFGKQFLPAIVDNLCPAVVDSVVDRLKVTGVNSTAAEQKDTTVNGRPATVVEDPLAAAAWAIWERNRMSIRAAAVHRDALVTGDGYAIVWPDARGRAAVWPQQPEEIAVRYSEMTPGELDIGARLWMRHDARLQLNLYYPDHTERYATLRDSQLRDLLGRVTTFVTGRQRVSEEVTQADVASAGAFYPLNDDTGPVVRNTYGRVPIFHFPNGRLWEPGLSELRDVFPLQRGLNKSIADMFVAMEFAAFPQRWATGMDIEVDETGKPVAAPFGGGVDRLWVAEDEKTNFGAFATADLPSFLQVQDSLRAEMARVSGTPLHYMMIVPTQGGSFPSGEAMKSAEARFAAKLDDKQEVFGDGWEDALEFGLEIEGATIPDGFELSTLWRPATPISEEERSRTLLMKRQLGASRRQMLREAGYADDLIDQMLAELATEPQVPTVVYPPLQPKDGAPIRGGNG